MEWLNSKLLGAICVPALNKWTKVAPCVRHVAVLHFFAAWCLKLPNTLSLFLKKILGQKTKVKLWALHLTKAKLGGNWPGSE